MQRGRLLIIMGIILGLATLAALGFFTITSGFEPIDNTVIDDGKIIIQPLGNRGDYKMIDTEEGVVCYRIGSGGDCFNR